jgi:carbonic anhydrase/acetyltransferase-like protein (isoleucine patch superfamily)
MADAPTHAGPLYALDGVYPKIHPTAFIAPTAVLIGDVEIGESASIWFGCILRGDTNRIRVGPRTNIQDGSILHVNPPDDMACLIGADVTVGHMAIIHAATLHDRAFVGMAAVVLDGAVIESGGVLAAGAVLPPGKRIAENELWMGSPAKLFRVMAEDERHRFALTAPAYVQNGIRFRNGLGR